MQNGLEKTAKSQSTAVVPSFRKIAGLTAPMLGLMLCHLGISLTDLWAAGRIDASVQAALGVVTQIFILMMLLTSMAGSGCLASVSQALGAGNKLRASRFAGLIIGMAFTAGSAVGILIYALLPLLLAIMRAPADIRPVVETFTGVYCLQLPFHYCMILFNSVFRAHQLVRLPLASGLLVLAANFVGSAGFGLGWWGLPAFGYAGIAWATFASTLLGLGCNLLFARQRKIIRRASFAPWKWNRRAMPYIFSVGVPAALGQLAFQSGNALMLGLVAALPNAAVGALAGMTLGQRVMSIAYFPMGAVSLSMAVFSGHLLGGGQKEPLYRFGLRSAFANMLIFIIPAALLCFFRNPLAALLSPDEQVLELAALCIFYNSLTLPCVAFSSVLNGIFSGTGATRYSALANIAAMWCGQLPLAWLLGYGLGWGEQGLFLAMAAADVMVMGCIFWLYKRQKWLECGLKKGQPARMPERATA